MSDSVERFLERLREVGGDAAVIKTFHPGGDERYSDEHIFLPVTWFKDVEERLIGLEAAAELESEWL